MDETIKKLIEKIILIRPEFGSITLDLIFHQSKLTKVIISDKTEIVLFNKEESKK